MASPRARLVVAHALAWTGWGAALALAAQLPPAPGSAALAVAVGAAVAALALALPVRAAPERHAALAVILALVVQGAALVSMLDAIEDGFGRVLLLLAPMGLHVRATLALAAERPELAPGLRLAPTLLALAAGAGIVAASMALGVPLLAVLVLAALLQAGALALLLAGRVRAERAPSPQAAPLGRALPLLALGAAGAAALLALRPMLSALGAEVPSPAGPAALSLAVAAIVGPPLARLAERLPEGVAAPVLATVAGACALVAPIARAGTADLVAALGLGVAGAAAVALVELARRAGRIPAPGALAVLALAAAVGAAAAAGLLLAVPLTDVVLGAAIACLVAGLGTWAPGVRERVAA